MDKNYRIAQKIVLGDEVLKTPKSKPQKVFKKVIDKWIDEQNKINKEIGIGKEEDLSSSYPYAFHDDRTVSVDADLYDILNYGEADFGIGKKMYEKLNDELKRAGYYLENEGQGVFIFAEN